MSRIRVLTLIDSLEEPGGAERLAVTIAAALPRARFDVTVATTRGARGELVAELEREQVPWFAVDRRGRYDVAPLRRLLHYMRSHELDVVHSHMFGSNFWASLIAPRTGVPVRIAHEHGSPYEGALGQTIRFFDHHLIGRVASAVVVGTEEERRNVVERGGIPPEKVTLIPAPFVARGPRETDLRAELGLDPSTPLVGTVAWLRQEKALEVLIDAFAELPASEPEAHLVIAGEGPTRGMLTARARQRGVAARTHMLGARDDAIAVLGALDVAVISSDRESTSLVALEAIAAGTPLVSTRVGGPAEFLHDGVSAMLVPRRDPSALAGAIGALLADPQLGARLAAAAREVLDGFSVGRVAEMHAELYERELARSRTTSSQSSP